MKAKSKYIVAFTGLQNGVHSFTNHLDRSFFAERDYSPVQEGNIEVELEFDKKDRFFVINFRYAGTIEVECDRCMEMITLPVNNAATLLVKMTESDMKDDLDDEILYISPTEIEIDYSQFLYENIVVNIPLYKTCEDNVGAPKACNSNVLSILNDDSNEQENFEQIDPRWNKLKQLKNKNNGTSEK